MDICNYLTNLRPPLGPVDVVLDSDTFNEADDQFAMAYLLLSAPELTVRGLCAAPFLNALVQSPAEGMEKSYAEMHHLLKLMGREDLMMMASGSVCLMMLLYWGCWMYLRKKY